MFDLFPASASAQIDTDTAVILLCHDLNRELPVLQAAREAKPFYLGALGSYRTHTLRLQKLHELGWSRERQRKSGHPSGYSPKPGMRIHWPSPCWQKSPLYVSIRRRIHACPRRPDPCGRAWKALSHLRGNTIN
ncbi:XdhC family protein [Escherichia coli]|uniref:XdhC family protein n=1 Tax=Escherichia coli TaxID=562 RepID=UPI003D80EA81